MPQLEEIITLSPSVIEKSVMIIEPMPQDRPTDNPAAISATGGFVWKHSSPSFHPEDTHQSEDSLFGYSNRNPSPNLSEKSADFNANIDTTPTGPVSIVVPVGLACQRQQRMQGKGSVKPSVNYLNYAAEMTMKKYPETRIQAAAGGTFMEFKETRLGAVCISGARDAALKARRHLLDTLNIRKTVHQLSIPQSHSAVIDDDWLAEHMEDPDMAATISVHRLDSTSWIEISGNPWQVDEARMVCQQLMDSIVRGNAVKTIHIPFEMMGKILGPAQKFALDLFLQNGVLLETAVPVQRGPILRTAALMLTCKQGDSLEAAEAIIKAKLAAESSGIAHTSFEMSAERMDWIISDRFLELCEILSENASSMWLEERGDQSITAHIYSLNEHLLQVAHQKIRQLLYQIHTALVCLEPKGSLSLSKQSHQFLLSMAQQIGIEMEWWQQKDQISANEILLKDSASLFFIKLCGYQEDISVALFSHILPHFQQFSQIHLFQYSLTNSSIIRDFVSGKKDGKLHKIMRDIGNLSLGIVDAEANGDIAFELSGTSAPAVMEALEMLEGELPAELVFHLPESHHRRLIGHGGQTIQKIMKQCAVYIKFLNRTEATRTHGHPELDRWERAVGMSEAANVVIKTPRKNLAALQEAKQMVFEMAADPTLDRKGSVVLTTKTIVRGGLLRLDREGLARLSALFQSHSGQVDLSLGHPSTSDRLELRIRGYQSSACNFIDELTDLVDQLEVIFAFF